MSALFIGLFANPITRKIILYSAVLAVVFLSLRWWGNKQWYAGEKQGRLYMAAEIEKKKAEEWKAKEEQLSKWSADLLSEQETLEARIQEIEKQRAEINAQLRRSLDLFQREREGQYEAVATVPNDDLWKSIRAISRELAAE